MRSALARRTDRPPVSSSPTPNASPRSQSSLRLPHRSRARGERVRDSSRSASVFLENVVVCLLLIALTLSLLALTVSRNRARDSAAKSSMKKEEEQRVNIKTNADAAVHVTAERNAPATTTITQTTTGATKSDVVPRDMKNRAMLGHDTKTLETTSPYEKPISTSSGAAGSYSDQQRVHGVVDYENVEIVSAFNPRAYVWHGFLSQDESRYLRDIAQQQGLRESKVVNSTSGARMSSTVRTSSGTFLSHERYKDDEVVTRIEERMDAWSQLPSGMVHWTHTHTHTHALKLTERSLSLSLFFRSASICTLRGAHTGHTHTYREREK